ncbi:hypothetical protein [Xanthomonas graminis]|uniref:hypothetical protein n=1 Tax=Xanthomonas graminis TaxID=3390026 RepID=UPI001F31608D|nr:hypothetical protein [Xanthomonas translucens]
MRAAVQVRGEDPVHHVGVVQQPDRALPLRRIGVRIDLRQRLQQLGVGPGLVGELRCEQGSGHRQVLQRARWLKATLPRISTPASSML